MMCFVLNYGPRQGVDRTMGTIGSTLGKIVSLGLNMIEASQKAVPSSAAPGEG